MSDEVNDTVYAQMIDKIEKLATKVGMLERENQDLKLQVQRLTLARDRMILT